MHQGMAPATKPQVHGYATSDKVAESANGVDEVPSNEHRETIKTCAKTNVQHAFGYSFGFIFAEESEDEERVKCQAHKAVPHDVCEGKCKLYACHVDEHLVKPARQIVDCIWQLTPCQ